MRDETTNEGVSYGCFSSKHSTFCFACIHISQLKKKKILVLMVGPKKINASVETIENIPSTRSVAKIVHGI